MGYNTTLMLMNDGLDAIDRDLESWWAYTRDAILRRDYTSQAPAGNHCNVSQVLGVEHADITQIVAVGGNCGSTIGLVLGSHHATQEDKLNLLKDLAGQLGYNVVKKRRIV